MATQYYVSLLKAHPWKTNLTSAAVLMLLGDVCAQRLECEGDVLSKVYGEIGLSDGHDHVKLQHRRTLNMKRYDLKEESRVHRHSKFDNDKNRLDCDIDKETDAIKNPLDIDLIRTSSMISWTMLISTPFFMQVFRLFEKYLPKSRSGSLPMRVILTSSCAIPTNFLFFVYATYSHALLEEYNNRRLKANYEAKSFASLLESTKTETIYKIEQEYINTVKLSITCWTPINFINQAFVPAHSRTIFMNVCQMFWNCYLSIAQHRDITLPEKVLDDDIVRPNVLIQTPTSLSSEGPDKATSV